MKKISLVLALVLVFGVLGISFSAEFQGTPEQALQTILKCVWFEQYKDPHLVGWQNRGKDCREVFPIYELYINRLTKEVIEQTDPEMIESTYQRWKETKDLKVVNTLIRLTKGNRIINQWTRFIDNFVKSCSEVAWNDQLHNSPDDLSLLKAIYWKGKFVEAYQTLLTGPCNLPADMGDVLKRLEKKIEKVNAEERRKEYEGKRRVEAEIAERKRIDEENRLKGYGVTAKVTCYELCSNPFKHEGKTVAILVMFKRMMERTTGVFSYPGSDCEILVSKLPSDLFTMTGQTAKLIVKGKGTTEVVNRLGVSFKIPHVEYISL